MRIDNENLGAQYAFRSNLTNEETYFQKDISKQQEENILNLDSIISILSNGYIYGDETLIEGITRVPWLENNQLILNNTVDTESKNLNSQEIALKLETLLIEEIKYYIQNYQSIGILLSGGLDSRILAGILRKIELDKGEDFNKTITVYNWGMKDSRDVIYAKRIADSFGWLYQHYNLDSERLKNNFYVNTGIGCEISPLHLHAMEDVAKDENTDVILAGTYGDSIGRGLFSGVHISNLTSKTHIINNKSGIIKTRYLKSSKETILQKRYNFIVNNSINSNVHEIDQYANYLRRMLTTPMSIIQQHKDIYQIFTAPNVYNFILNLPKEKRTDEIYKNIMSKLPSGIGQIPYAKNGKDFTRKNSLVYDNYSKISHNYGFWLRNDLFNFVKENYDVNLLYSTGIFNKGSLESLFKLWSKSTNLTNNSIDEKISFLTNLCIYIKNENIKISSVLEKEDLILPIFKKIRNRSYLELRNRLRD